MMEITYSIDFCQVITIIHPPNNEQFKLKNTWFRMMETVWTKILPKYEGTIFFMEEDSLVSPDFYLVLKTMNQLQKRRNDVFGVSLSPFLIRDIVPSNPDPYAFRWTCSMANTNYGFNRTVWNSILANKKKFFGLNERHWLNFYNIQFFFLYLKIIIE